MGILTRYTTKANGKIIIIDFSKLNPDAFIGLNLTKQTIKKELILPDIDGRLFINTKMELADYLSSVFEILMETDAETLKIFHATRKQKYKNVTLFNIDSFNGPCEEKNEAIAMLLIPLELQRREREASYYNR